MKKNKNIKKLISTEEAANILNVSEPRIYQLRVAKRLPYTKVGRFYFYDLEFLKKNKKQLKLKKVWKFKKNNKNKVVGIYGI